MRETAQSATYIHQVQGTREKAMRLLGLGLNLWLSTLRYSFKSNFGPETVATDPGALILLWHNRLLPAIGGLRYSLLRERRMRALVSASRDGAQITHFMSSVGIDAIRGSSSRRGAGAAREIVKALNKGDFVSVTVDGPRGPRYVAQAGAAMLAQATGAPLYFIGVECEHYRAINSWDRFILPYPGSRVKATLDRVTLPDFEEGRGRRLAIQGYIQEKLETLTDDIHPEDPV